MWILLDLCNVVALPMCILNIPFGIKYYRVSKTNSIVELPQHFFFFFFGETIWSENILWECALEESLTSKEMSEFPLVSWLIIHPRPRIPSLTRSLVKISVMSFLCLWRSVKENVDCPYTHSLCNLGFYISFPMFNIKIHFWLRIY